MKIAIISKSDRTGGGASKIAELLAEELYQQGHLVHHFARSFNKGPSHEYQKLLYGKLSKFIYYRFKSLGFQEFIPFEYWSLRHHMKEYHYDVIHVHDTLHTLSALSLLWLSKYAPIVWTMHDCSVFTGGCISPMECTRYHQGCFGCPQHGQYNLTGLFKLEFFHLWLKKILLRTGRITLVGPSEWIIKKATGCDFIPQKPLLISNGVNLNHFKTIDKMDARKSLGLSKERFIIALSSSHLSDQRKGIRHAVDIIRQLKGLNPFIILIGQKDPHLFPFLEGIDLYWSGYLASDQELNLHYGCADLLLYCSLADNQPLTVLESMASGTPVFGFSVGGVGELIKQNTEGYLVDPKEKEDLAKIIEQFYMTKQLELLSQNSRDKIEKHYPFATTASHYSELYKAVVSKFIRHQKK